MSVLGSEGQREPHFTTGHLPGHRQLPERRNDSFERLQRFRNQIQLQIDIGGLPIALRHFLRQFQFFQTITRSGIRLQRLGVPSSHVLVKTDIAVEKGDRAGVVCFSQRRPGRLIHLQGFGQPIQMGQHVGDVHLQSSGRDLVILRFKVRQRFPPAHACQRVRLSPKMNIADVPHHFGSVFGSSQSLQTVLQCCRERERLVVGSQLRQRVDLRDGDLRREQFLSCGGRCFYARVEGGDRFRPPSLLLERDAAGTQRHRAYPRHLQDDCQLKSDLCKPQRFRRIVRR